MVGDARAEVAMSETKVFTVEIEVQEHPDHTEAKAILDLGDHPQGGWGRARRNPADPDRPHLGDEVAIARALRDLAEHLLGLAAEEIERAEHQPVHLHM
jgi:Rv2632c-like